MHETLTELKWRLNHILRIYSPSVSSQGWKARQSRQGFEPPSSNPLPTRSALLLAKYWGENGFRRMVTHVSKLFLQIKFYSPKKNHKLPDLSFQPHTHIPRGPLILTCFYQYTSLAHNVLGFFVFCFF